MGSTPSFGTNIKVEDKSMSWGDACQLLLQGKRMRRTAWLPSNDYLFMRADVIHIKNFEGEHRAIINSGDMAATDWTEYLTVQ
jgi:hypothetical protein